MYPHASKVNMCVLHTLNNEPITHCKPHSHYNRIIYFCASSYTFLRDFCQFIDNYTFLRDFCQNVAQIRTTFRARHAGKAGMQCQLFKDCRVLISIKISRINTRLGYHVRFFALLIHDQSVIINFCRFLYMIVFCLLPIHTNQQFYAPLKNPWNKR